MGELATVAEIEVGVESTLRSIRTIGPYKLIATVLPTDKIDEGARFRQKHEDGGELENSIKEHGILQSLLVLERPDEKYLLLAGGRRFRCAQNLNLPEVPVLIATKELDELDIRTIELIENMHRRALAYEEDLAIKDEIHRLQQKKYGTSLSGGAGGEKRGWRVEDTANLLGVSKATISNDLRLAKAMQVLPELRGLKDKKAANKILDALVKGVIQEERAQNFEKEMEKDEGPYRKLCDSYIVADFFDRVGALPDGSFDFVELDPFYGIELLDLYAKRSGNGTAYIKENYTDVPKEVYEWYIRSTLRECYRVMSPNSWGICWFAMEPWFEPTFQAIKDAGFFCRRVPGFWVQPSGAAYNANLLLASAVDSFFYFRKGQPILNAPGTSNAFLCGLVSPTKKIHPTERPVELYDMVLNTFVGPGSRMLVPFTGSGNQLLSASNLRINAVGFDLCQDYKNGFTIRVNESEYGHYKSFK
jgi:ParB-like chromosome segregation protein Spo0J